MGFRYIDLGDNYAQLVVDYEYWESPNDYYDTDSIEEALEYFHLTINEVTGLLKRNNEEITETLGLHNEEEIANFLEQLKKLGETLTKEQILENELLFLEWSPRQNYLVGDKVYYKDGVYECLQEHTSYIDDTPWDLHDCWQQVLPDSKIDEWHSNSNYANGDLITYEGDIYQSLIDGNNYLPDNSTYWEMTTEG